MRSRNDIGRFLNRRGLLGSGVEVGAARGDFSRVILDSWQGQKLYLVDCWTPQDKFDYQDIHNVDQARHEQNLSHLQSHLKRHEGRYEIIRAFSRDATLRFEDASLDFRSQSAAGRLVTQAQAWRWSSLGCQQQIAAKLLSPWPLERPTDWLQLVNEPLPDAPRQRIQSSMKRGQPLGDERWTQSIARRLGLQFTLNPHGRPRKKAAGKEAK